MATGLVEAFIIHVLVACTCKIPLPVCDSIHTLMTTSRGSAAVPFIVIKSQISSSDHSFGTLWRSMSRKSLKRVTFRCWYRPIVSMRACQDAFALAFRPSFSMYALQQDPCRSTQQCKASHWETLSLSYFITRFPPSLSYVLDESEPVFGARLIPAPDPNRNLARALLCGE